MANRDCVCVYKIMVNPKSYTGTKIYRFAG